MAGGAGQGPEAGKKGHQENTKDCFGCSWDLVAKTESYFIARATNYVVFNTTCYELSRISHHMLQPTSY